MAIQKVVLRLQHLGEELSERVGAAIQVSFLLEGRSGEEELDRVLQPVDAADRQLHNCLPCTAFNLLSLVTPFDVGYPRVASHNVLAAKLMFCPRTS